MERMKEKQEHIYFMAAPSRAEAESSPFVERLLKKGYEVLYLVDPVDEYTVQVSCVGSGVVLGAGTEFGQGEGEGSILVYHWRLGHLFLCRLLHKCCCIFV